ncbi:hypothetical protein TVAG_236610 [Trichomonas vaginalis G3]|uniref:Uncharacterized protein n=1 Tax=Trichomonas vaginalis (strain ATCC PRA-98 / G3) TaxID=412133 RepID=A2F7A1_TRIV3|nr:TAG-278-related family [Trichomonas vaginalis G3]EAX99216.1 hypothetical protein TVAG_236610 [Trichomonas vaginalis G3]KAI5538732.1 TAG-278-related family [Trichomonas vaginalis G3]|eukprot:XP_001312146.1 hypothetical protein [Trichomonas vaginalis G3]
MILDAESCLFLTNKKLYQLCKLIDHLGFQIAQHNFEIEMLRKKFNCSLDILEEKYQSKVREKYLKGLVDQVVKEVDFTFKERHKAIQDKFMNAVISINTEMTESDIELKSNIKKVALMVQQLNQEINNNTTVINNLCNQTMKNLKDQLQKAQAKHEDAIRLHDKEQLKQVHNLEVETKENLAHLDDDFNESVAHLKKSFLGTNNKNLINKLQTYKGDLEFIAENLQNSKSNANDYIGLYNINMQKWKKQLQQTLKSLPDVNENPYKAQDESEQTEYNNQKKELLAQRENLFIYRQNELSDLKSQLQTIKTTKLEVKPQEATEYIEQKFKDELLNLNNEQEEEVKGVEDSIIHLNKVIQELKEEIVVHKKRLQVQINKDKEEIEQAVKNHLKKIDQENKRYEAKYLDLVEALQLLKGLPGDDKKIQETEKLRDILKHELELVKKESANLPKDDFQKNVGSYLEYQKDLTNSDLSDFEKQEQVYINVLAQTYKNGYENKYNRIQEEIATEVSRIQEEFEALPSQRENVDSQLQRKYLKTQKELESIEIPDEYQKFLKEMELQRKIMIEEAKSRIAKEKELLLSEFTQKLSEEENRHMNYLSGISLFQSKGETQYIRDQFALKRRELSEIIDKHNQELIELKEFSVRDMIASVIKEYDDEELRLNKILAELNVESHNKLVQAQNARKVAVATLQNTILNERKKNHSDQNQYRKMQKEQDPQEMMDELQKKLDMITGSISNLWIKEKERSKGVRERKVQEFLKIQKGLADEKLQKTLDLEKTAKENESEYQSRENMNLDDIENKSDSYESELAKLRESLQIKRKRFAEIKDEYESQRNNFQQLYNSKSSRPEEISRIDRLDNQLKMLEGHKKQLLKDFKLIKEQLIMNDDVITSRFGVSPNVSILRAASSMQPARPFTATPGLRKPIKR